MATPSLLQLKAIRGFHVGGNAVQIRDKPAATLNAVPGLAARASDPNGQIMVGQMYVQHFQHAAPTAPWPLYFWHGGGMTGCTWEDKPDGGAGWHDYFMRCGYDTLLCDAVERGRAGWPLPGTTSAGTPEARTLEQAWELFRLGARDEQGQWRPHDAQLFPTEHIEQFSRQFVPRWTAHRHLAVQAYTELLHRTGPGIVIAHSEGGRLAQEVAQRSPGLIKALVLIEPAGGTAPQDLHALQALPVCAVWGDYFPHSALWQDYRKSFDAWAQALQAAGGRVDTLDLPQRGLRGNSHFPMMDRNSTEVAGLVHGWLRQAVPSPA